MPAISGNEMKGMILAFWTGTHQHDDDKYLENETDWQALPSYCAFPSCAGAIQLSLNSCFVVDPSATVPSAWGPSFPQFVTSCMTTARYQYFLRGGIVDITRRVFLGAASRPLPALLCSAHKMSVFSSPPAPAAYPKGRHFVVIPHVQLRVVYIGTSLL
jgi:hypothetical protein